jgi:hypothetical protein
VHGHGARAAAEFEPMFRRRLSSDCQSHGGGTFIRQRRALGVLTSRYAWRKALRLPAVWTEEGELFTFGYGGDGKLGHGGYQNEPVPRLVEVLAVVCASVPDEHTAVWTAAGEVFTFGDGHGGKLGHGGEQNEPVPRLVGALAQ